jgi:hypothetical protein
MAKDDTSIPSWQKAVPEKASDLHKDIPNFEFKEVEQMPPVPTREQAAKFLEHPGTNNATAEDKIRFLEVKGVQRSDIETLIPEAKKYYETVSCAVLFFSSHICLTGAIGERTGGCRDCQRCPTNVTGSPI